MTELQVRWLRGGATAILGILYVSLLAGSGGGGLATLAGAIALGVVVGHLLVMPLVLVLIVIALPIRGPDGFDDLEWAPVLAVYLVPASAIGVGIAACLRRLIPTRAASVSPQAKETLVDEDDPRIVSCPHRPVVRPGTPARPRSR